MEKVKMDKIRRMLGNRYGEDGRMATMKLLNEVLDAYIPTIQNCINEDGADTAGWTQEQLDTAKKCLADIVIRAEKEPRVVEVDTDEE